MKITKKQFEKIEKYFPVQRGNVKINNYDFINAILYIAESGCKWRALPREYGNWNSIYKRFNRWVNNGVIQRIFTVLQQERIIAIKVEVLALDSTSWTWSFKKHGKQSIRKSKGGWNTKLHVVSADDKTIIEMHLSEGNRHDAPKGRSSIEKTGNDYQGIPYLMDKAYEGDKTRDLAFYYGHEPVVTPKKNRLDPYRKIIPMAERILKSLYAI